MASTDPDQAALEGLKVLDVKNRLEAMARELSILDVQALANAARSGSADEELAVAFLDCKRRLRQTGVLAHLAMTMHREQARDA